ncbi:MAG: hypothetical protein ACJAQT_004041 [Akkermansiaceae bacterium]|jgi:hypothetical protein
MMKAVTNLKPEDSMNSKYTSIAILAGTALVANAAVIVNTLPANNQANLNADAGQTFTTTVLGAENALSTIEIEGPQSANGTDPMGPFTLELHTDLDGDHSTWGTGSLIASSDSQTFTAGGATISIFTFASQPVLADSTPYAFVFTDGLGTRVNARWGLTNATAISDGTLFGEGEQVFGNAFDSAMRITTVAPVPEPSSALLVALSGLALLRRRRR